MRRFSNWRSLCALLAVSVYLDTAAASELMDLSLEELASFKITSVTKKESSLQESAAAVYVITGEDMKRSGYTSVAEALRMVPGIQVARTNSHDWDIGARGFNTGLASNKLLVLIDGRSVYSPLFAGVFWELRDVPVEDIERIEVIRGPGAALWGANAVNGVINIITRPSAEARGWTLRGGGGTEERAQGLVRYGGALSEDADLRLSLSGFQRDGGHHRSGVPDDDWWLTRFQGRSDWRPTDSDRVMTSFGVFGGQLDQDRPLATVSSPTLAPESEQARRVGVYGLTRWEHDLSADSDFALQLWYEYSDIEFTVLREERHTVDLDAQHHFALGERQNVTWGAAYRFSYDEEQERGSTTLDPRIRGVSLVTAFIQDQISLFPERLTITLGSKFEYNEFTNFEYQPSARLAWTPNPDHTLWSAVSRAVRTPTRLDSDSDLGLVVVPAGAPSPFADATRPTLLVLRGDDRFKGEDVLAVEAGYRARLHESFNVDVAAFYNRYEDLGTFEFGAVQIVPASGSVPEHRIFPFVLDNQMDGFSYGVEAAAWWQVQPWWRMHASYSFLRLWLDTDRGSLDGGSEDVEGQSPQHQAFLRNSFDLPHGLVFDGMLRFVDRLHKADVDGYFELDLRLAWNFCEDWEVALVGQNLLHSHHRESEGASPGVERGVYGSLTWRFGADR